MFFSDSRWFAPDGGEPESQGGVGPVSGAGRGGTAQEQDYKSENGGASVASERRDSKARVVLGAHGPETLPHPASLQQPLPKMQAGVEAKRQTAEANMELDSRDALTGDQETKIAHQAKTISDQATKIAEQDDEIKGLNQELSVAGLELSQLRETVALVMMNEKGLTLKLQACDVEEKALSAKISDLV